jgi:hypothetical protein
MVFTKKLKYFYSPLKFVYSCWAQLIFLFPLIVRLLSFSLLFLCFPCIACVLLSAFLPFFFTSCLPGSCLFHLRSSFILYFLSACYLPLPTDALPFLLSLSLPGFLPFLSARFSDFYNRFSVRVSSLHYACLVSGPFLLCSCSSAMILHCLVPSFPS